MNATPRKSTTKPKTRCAFCYRPIHRQRSGTWYHDYTSSVSCRPGWSSNRATPAARPAERETTESEPRSLGGDLPVSRRCHRGLHSDCLGYWTAYPDQGGPCECSCHRPTAALHEPANDIEATGRCCCAGCVGMGPCDRADAEASRD